MNKLENIKLGNKIIVKAKLLNKTIMRIYTSDIYVQGTIEYLEDNACNVNYICPENGMIKTSRYSFQEIFSF